MFCSYCGRKNKDNYKFCIICGKPLPQKAPEETLDNIINGALLICKKINGGRILSDSGAWLYTKWTIFSDHKMVCESKYDRGFFTAAEPRILTSDTVLSEEAFNALKTWMDEIFPTAAVSSGCDGTLWEISTLDKNGNILYTTRGFLYNNEAFKPLLEILKENP